VVGQLTRFVELIGIAKERAEAVGAQFWIDLLSATDSGLLFDEAEWDRAVVQVERTADWTADEAARVPLAVYPEPRCAWAR
jgi:hypothetical protein